MFIGCNWAGGRDGDVSLILASSIITSYLPSQRHAIAGHHPRSLSLPLSSPVMGVTGDDIADTVLKQFHDLPAKGKLQERGGGVKEWVPLCGIVAQGLPAL